MSDSDDLECPVCLEVFREPRMLPCGHTLCNVCIQELVTNPHSVTCPEDRKIHKLPANGVTGFPINYLAVRQLEKRCRQCRKSSPQTECPHCNTNLCLQCVRKHINYADVKTDLHKLRDAIDAKTAELQNTESSYKHQQQTLMGDIDALGKMLHAMVDDRMKQLQISAKGHNAPQQAWCDDVKAKLKMIKTTTDKLDIADIAEVTDDVMSQLKVSCEQELHHLEDISQPPAASLVLKHDVGPVESAIKALGSIIKEVASEPTQAKAERSRASRRTGDVVRVATPRVIGQKGKGPGQFVFPSDVCENPVTGHLVVADQGNNRIQILDGVTHNHIRDITGAGPGEKLRQPYRLHCTSRGDIVTSTHDDKVIMYASDGSYTTHLSAPWSNPRGVSSDANHVYICDAGAHVIRVFSPDGDYMKDISNPVFISSGPRRITISTNHIIVSCGSTIHHLTMDGEVVRTLDDVVSGDIWGLATDTDDNLYITTWRDPITVVSGMSVIQRVVQCGGDEPWKLRNPCGITVTRERKLIVANTWNSYLLVYDLI